MGNKGMGIALLVIGALYTPIVLIIIWGVMSKLHSLGIN
jgi:hypothetical protein